MAKPIKAPTPKPAKPSKKAPLALPASTLSANNCPPLQDPPLPHYGREVINPNRQYKLLKKKAKK
jgi:hypothetical protein